MLSIPLILLGSMLMLVTIMIFIVFMIAGGFRRSRADTRVLITSGITGLAMVGLGVLVGRFGSSVLIILIPILFWGLAIFGGRIFEGVKVRHAHIGREGIKLILRYVIRVGIISGAILLLNVVGLWGLLSSSGQWNLVSFTELLTLLLLLEGLLIGAAGGLMVFGYSEYRIAGQAAIIPAIARDQLQRWRERRLSQQKWGIATLIAGLLLTFLGLLVSALASV